MDTYLKFKRAGRNCLLCGVSLPELERHPTMLKLTEKEEIVREDICPTCWSKMAQREYFSYWITKRFQAGPSPEERRLAKSERNEALWALFNALYARDDASDLAPQLFLLAHLLMKYRILRYIGTEDEENTPNPSAEAKDAAGGAIPILIFQHAPTSETFRIPDLPLDQIPFVDAMNAVESQVADYAPAPAGEQHDDDDAYLPDDETQAAAPARDA